MRAAAAIARKDLLVELRTKESVPAMALFAVTTFVIFHFALDRDTLEAALEGWLKGESDEAVRDRAAKAYHQYQKCGLRAARRLLVAGW